MGMTRDNYQGLRDDIEALYEYTDRSNFNLKVVEVMVEELRSYIAELKECEKAEAELNKKEMK